MALTLLLGYLLGSISTGVVLSRLFGHTDIRSQGSGNSGTTNMLRVMGKKFALLTLAGDMLKGILAVLIGKALVGGVSGEILGAFGAILGHNFPVFFGFKGGKGIATSFGCLLVVFPWQTLSAFGVFLLLLIVLDVGMIVSLVRQGDERRQMIVRKTSTYTVVWGSIAAIGLLAICRHHQNIVRLIHHTESKVSFGSKKKGKD